MPPRAALRVSQLRRAPRAFKLPYTEAPAHIAALTTKQRAHLKSLAHHLKPLLHVGKDGVTDAAVRSVADAFNTRELIKVKVLDSAPEGAKESAAALAARLAGVHLVQVIGRTLVLYRPHPDKPEIKLPPSARPTNPESL